MPWFTKYVEKLAKGVNELFHESRSRTQAEGPSGPPRARGQRARRPHGPRQDPRQGPLPQSPCHLDVVCCTGRRISYLASSVGNPVASASAARATASNFTEEDFSAAPTVAYPKARPGALYSLLLVDLKGHFGLHARSHRLSWVQHNIPGAAFARGDISSGTICTPYRPPCCRRGSLHVLAMVFEQCRVMDDVSPMFADDCRLPHWLSKYGAFASRMVVCDEFQAHVQRSSIDSTDSDACSAGSGELELPTVSFHRLGPPARHRHHSHPHVLCSAGVDRRQEKKWRPLDSPQDCPKRMKVF